MCEVKADDESQQVIEDLLPDDVDVKFDDEGFVEHGSLPDVCHEDQYFNYMKDLVASEEVVEVRMGEGPDFVVDPSAPEKIKKQAEALQSFWYNGEGDLFLGFTAGPMGSYVAHSGTNNMVVSVADLPSVPYHEIKRTMAHELFTHAWLYVVGRPWQHGDPGFSEQSQAVDSRFQP